MLRFFAIEIYAFRSIGLGLSDTDEHTTQHRSSPLGKLHYVLHVAILHAS